MRLLIDTTNENLFAKREEFDNFAGEHCVESFVLDETMEGPMYTALTAAETPQKMFKTLHEAIVACIHEKQTNDPEAFLELDPKEVFKKALDNIS